MTVHPEARLIAARIDGFTTATVQAWRETMTFAVPPPPARMVADPAALLDPQRRFHRSLEAGMATAQAAVERRVQSGAAHPAPGGSDPGGEISRPSGRFRSAWRGEFANLVSNAQVRIRMACPPALRDRALVGSAMMAVNRYLCLYVASHATDAPDALGAAMLAAYPRQGIPCAFASATGILTLLHVEL